MQLLSTLILLSWTICNGSALSSLVKFVTLPKNFNHHTTIPEKDHQTSDFWWDDKALPKFDQQQDIQIPNSTLDSLLAPFIPNIAFIHKTLLFSKTAESSDLLLLHTPHSHSNHRTNHYLHPYNIHSPAIAAKPEIFISRRSTTKQSQYRNLRFSETITTRKISNYLTSLLLSMSQRAVLRLTFETCFLYHDLSSSGAAFKAQPAHKKISSTVADWTQFLDTLYLPAKRIQISGLPID
jgi:hypothetical protein